MNFHTLCEAILVKVKDDIDAQKALEIKILSNPHLTKQFAIYNSLKENMETAQAETHVMFLEKYISKLNYEDLEEANRELAHYFNINSENLNSTDIDSAIDEMLRINSGGTVVLSEGTRYKSTIVDYLTQKKILNESKPEQVLRLVAEDVTEVYSNLNPIEEDFVTLVRSKSDARLKNKLKIMTKLTDSLGSNKDKAFVKECINTLSEDLVKKPFEEVAYKTFELREAVIELLEEEGGSDLIKLPDMKYLKNVKLFVLDDKDKPGTIFVSFDIEFYPLGSDYSSLKNSLSALNKRFGRLGTNILNQTIYWKNRQGQFFTGTGIWDGSVRIEGVKPGQKVPGRGEMTFDTVQTGKPRGFQEFQKPATEILADLDALIPKWFPETNPENQKEFLKVVSEPSPETQNDKVVKHVQQQLKKDKKSHKPGEEGDLEDYLKNLEKK